MQVKTCPAQIKAAGTQEGAEEGVVEAIVAAYNVDSIGDKIIPGAFKKTLERRVASGNPLPFVWNHMADDPDYHIGVVEEIEERPEGLWVKARLDLDEPKAAKVYKLLKGRRINEFSFAYTEIDVRPAGKADDGARKELHELDIHECGPTMLGCNRETQLLAVKHDPTAAEAAAQIVDSATALEKAGRTLSRANEEALRGALSAIQKVLGAMAPAEPEDQPENTDSNAEKAAPAEPADAPASQVAPEAAPEAKSDVPAVPGVADERLRTRLQLMELEAATLTL